MVEMLLIYFKIIAVVVGVVIDLFNVLVRVLISTHSHLRDNVVEP